MQLLDILQQAGGLSAMARELGVGEAEASAGADALLPAIVGGFKRQAQAQPNGLEGIGDVLRQFGGPTLLDDVLAPQPTDVGRGNQVLGHIFGSPDVSRTVAQHASTQSGVGVAVLKKMLPMLAMAVGGLLARQQAAPSAYVHQADPLGELLAGALGSAPGGGTPGFGAMLDLNGDGNPLDDILRMAGSVLGSARGAT